MGVKNGIAEVWALAVEVAARSHGKPLNTLSGPAGWALDDNWWIAVNPTKETAPAPGRGDHSVALPPFCVYVEWLGWPAGIISKTGGPVAAGEAANEETLIVALKAKLATLPEFPR